MKKIAYFLWQFPRRGETFIAREVESLREKHVDVITYSFLKAKFAANGSRDNPPLAFGTILLGFLLILLRCPLKSIRWPLKSLYRLYRKPGRCLIFLRYYPRALAYARDARKKGASHLHAHFANTPAELAMAAADVLEMEFSFSAHARDIYAESNCLWMEEKFQRASTIITCTDANKKHMGQKWGHDDKIHLVYHGVPVSKGKFPQPSQCSTICAGGRLVEKKGLERLLFAMDICRRDFKFTPSVLIFGDGSLHNRLEVIKKLLRLDNVTLAGELDNDEVVQIMGNCRMFVHPNIIAHDGDRDGLANTMLEAMSTGRPVLASDTGANPELITDNWSGWLADAECYEKLAEKIFCAWHSQDIDTLGENARKTIEERFTLQESSSAIYSVLFAQEENSISG